MQNVRVSDDGTFGCLTIIVLLSALFIGCPVSSHLMNIQKSLQRIEKHLEKSVEQP